MNNTAQKQQEAGPTIEQMVKHTYAYHMSLIQKNVTMLRNKINKNNYAQKFSWLRPRDQKVLAFMESTMHCLQRLEEERKDNVFLQHYLDLKKENDFLHDKLLESYGYPPAGEDCDITCKRLIAEAAAASARSRAQWHLGKRDRKKRGRKKNTVFPNSLRHAAGGIQSEVSGWSDHVGGADY